LILNLSFAQDSGFDKGEGVKIKFHEENYFYLYSHISPRPSESSKSGETQFQLSVKFSPLRFNGGELSLAYTQKAFWQIYDTDNSRPFRETNYNPEIFLRYGPKNLFMDLGYEHESNGKSDPDSRSWDTAYLKVSFVSRNFKMALKSWMVVDEDKYGAKEEERKHSMKDYYGYHSLEAGFLTGTTILKLYGRKNFSTEKGYAEGKLLFLLTEGLYWAQIGRAACRA